MSPISKHVTNYRQMTLYSADTLLRLRIHLGLKIPQKGCEMEISGTKVNWTEGGVIVFDDSFEHWVWNDSEEERMIFILDIPHPDLTEEQRKRNMFHLE